MSDSRWAPIASSASASKKPALNGSSAERLIPAAERRHRFAAAGHGDGFEPGRGCGGARHGHWSGPQRRCTAVRRRRRWHGGREERDSGSSRSSQIGRRSATALRDADGVGMTAAAMRHEASLREDYLSQVQRDFLSRTAGWTVQHPQRRSRTGCATKRLSADWRADSRAPCDLSRRRPGCGAAAGWSSCTAGAPGARETAGPRRRRRPAWPRESRTRSASSCPDRY